MDRKLLLETDLCSQKLFIWQVVEFDESNTAFHAAPWFLLITTYNYEKASAAEKGKIKVNLQLDLHCSAFVCREKGKV